MKPLNFGHMISHGQEAYLVSLKQNRLVKMIVIICQNQFGLMHIHSEGAFRGKVSVNLITK